MERGVKGDMRRRKAILIAGPHVAAITVRAHDGVGRPAYTGREVMAVVVITDRYHVCGRPGALWSAMDLPGRRRCVLGWQLCPLPVWGPGSAAGAAEPVRSDALVARYVVMAGT